MSTDNNHEIENVPQPPIDVNRRILTVIEGLLTRMVDLEKRITVLEETLSKQNEVIELRLRAMIASLGGLLIESSKPPMEQQPTLELRLTSSEEKITDQTLIIFEDEGKYHAYNLVLPNGQPIPMNIKDGQLSAPPADVIIAFILEKLEDTPHRYLNDHLIPVVKAFMEEKQTRFLLVNAYHINQTVPNVH